MTPTDFNQLRDQLTQARAGAQKIRDALYAAKQALRRIDAERAALDRIYDPLNREQTARRARLDESRKQAADTITRLQNELARATSAEAGLLGQFGRLADPRRQIRACNDAFPFLLLPVRMETRWKSSTELWVRIYPDECAIDSFEAELTDAEIRSAQQYWIEIWRAAGIEAQERAAWRALAGSSGSGRAQWITESYLPANMADKPAKADPSGIVLVITAQPALAGTEQTAAFAYWKSAYDANGNSGGLDAARQGLIGAVGEARAAEIIASYRPVNFAEVRAEADAPVQVAALVFPPVEAAGTKATGWSKAPVTRVMPDRFVLIGYSGSAEVFTAIGNPIPSPLVAGPDPSATPEDQIQHKDGDLQIPDEMRWMIDFDRAVQVGMGFRVSLNAPQANTGLSRLIAIGVRLSQDEKGGQRLVEDLLRHHQRTRKGFVFVPQGTPTNNTDGKSSGFSRVDDPDISFDDIFKPRAPIPGADPLATRFDGEWFADLVGINPEVIRTTHGMSGTDQCEARAMNQALWPATLGYWMDTMMRPVFSRTAIGQTQGFFTNYVSGRGPIPAIRIGYQPYGILPATAYSRMNWMSSTGLAPNRAVVGGNYLKQLYGVLQRIDKDWAQLSSKPSFVGKSGDPGQVLLDILGLQATSVEYYQRYSESLDHLFNLFQFGGLAGALMALLIAMGYQQSGLALLGQLGYAGTGAPDILNKFFLTSQNLLKGPVVDTGEFSETDGIRPSTTDGRNYIQWLIDSSKTSLEALRLESGFKDGKTPTALLYIYLRHALMLGYWNTSLLLHQSAQIALPALVNAEPAFVHVAAGPQAQTIESRFSYLYRAEPHITSNPTMLVSEYIPKILPQAPEATYLRTQLQALEYLKGIPTARLERLFAEHMDSCTYRLDAWLMGLLKYQLMTMRYLRNPTGGGGDLARQGLYLGAFGWLEDVKPGNDVLTPVELPADLQSVFNTPGQAPLMRDSNNGGHIHAPSLNHAVTAAVLRNGYLANATPANPSTMAVNLSSDRVRLALSILEGIRGGQSAGALLGYRFERGLHDRHNEAEVDQFIHQMRRAFPLVSNQIPATKTDDEGVSIDAIEARNVLDGVKLVEHIRRTGNRAYPFGIPLLLALPQPNPGQAAAINAETDAALDLYDALADLALAEGVHQAVQGNYDRVASTLDAFSKGNFPPEPAVAQTPRTGIAITHRVGLQLDPAAAPGATPRSQAEPSLNHWLSQVMPAAASIFCAVSYTDPVTAAAVTIPVSLADLQLEPIDLLFLVRLENEQAMGELDDRVSRFVHKTAPPRPDATLRLSYLTAPAGNISAFELAAMVDALRALVLKSRPLRATDVALQTESQQDHDADVSLDRNRVVILQSGLTTLRGALQAYATSLKNLFDDIDNQRALIIDGVDASIDQLVELLSTAGLLGLPQAGWGNYYDWKRQTFARILDQAREVVTRWQTRLVDFDAILVDYGNLPGAADDTTRFDLLRSAERLISTQPVNPLPADPEDFKNTLGTKRGTFVTRLIALNTDVVERGTVSLADMLSKLRPLLPLTDFDLQDLALDDAESAIVTFASDLMDRANALAIDADRRAATVGALLTQHDASADATKRVEFLAQAVKAVLGDDFVVVPDFGIDAAKANEWANAYAAGKGGDLLKFLADPPNEMPFPVDTWMYGVARVRPKVRAWEKLVTLAQALSNKDLSLDPMQLPAIPDDRWLALEYPPDLTVSGDKLLYTASYSVEFDKTARQCGLLIDEWNEVIPGDAETTGITLNYDRPNAEAPQVMLLVTPSSFQGAWQWPDLIDAVNETLDMAKKRAVEPAHVDDTAYARFLPATVMAVTLYPISISANLAVNNNVLTQVER